MGNHPIPQDVTGFQFKLIGNMTVKQFAYLVMGAVLAWAFLQLPVNILIKLPLSIFSASFGAGLAFLPIGGRPMDLMIANYVKALFRPTQFVYQKVGGQIYFPNRSPLAAVRNIGQYKNTFSPFPKDKLRDYLESLDIKPKNKVSTPATDIEPLKDIPLQKPAPQTKLSQGSVANRPSRELVKNISPSNIPDSPNLITGIAKDPRGNALPSILVEVKDKEGNPVRAFKTNELGRFASATPLTNGTYAVEFEDPKGQNRFEKMTVNVDGQIILPIEVISIDTREELRKSLFASGIKN